VRACNDACYSGDLQRRSMSPWVAAVELIVNGTVSKKEAEVPKGGEISNPHRYPPTRTRPAGNLHAKPVGMPNP
jgi:hypothetical protein